MWMQEYKDRFRPRCKAGVPPRRSGHPKTTGAARQTSGSPRDDVSSRLTFVDRCQAACKVISLCLTPWGIFARATWSGTQVVGTTRRCLRHDHYHGGVDAYPTRTRCAHHIGARRRSSRGCAAVGRHSPTRDPEPPIPGARRPRRRFEAGRRKPAGRRPRPAHRVLRRKEAGLSCRGRVQPAALRRFSYRIRRSVRCRGVGERRAAIR
jgi:hypothetical protein